VIQALVAAEAFFVRGKNDLVAVGRGNLRVGVAKKTEK